MKKKIKRWLLALLLLCGSGTSFADLLDEEEPSVEPKGPVEATPQDKPDVKPTPAPVSQGKAPAKSDKNNGKALDNKPAGKPEKNGKSVPPVKQEPVHFESKGLRGLREKGTVELIEDVIVTQGELRLEADRAQIFYDEDQKEVVRVVAAGNVKISNVEQATGEKMKAYSNQVQFNNKDRTVVMEGNARLWRGSQSVIRGKKITYEIDSGWIKADRVAGELQPEEKKK